LKKGGIDINKNVNDKLEVVCIIPARSGSKSIPHKNIYNLGGHPLIAWSIKAALNADSIDRVIVSTDSEEYKDISIEYGAEVPFLRPKDISEDNSTDLEFFQHVIRVFEETSYNPDLIIHLRPTTPLRDSRVIDDAINNFDSTLYSSMRSVHRLYNPIEKAVRIEDQTLVSGIDGDSAIEKYTNAPRQKFPEYYEPNGYVDIVKPDLISKKNLLIGNNCLGYITDKAIDVDDIEDFIFLEYIIKKNGISLPK